MGPRVSERYVKLRKLTNVFRVAAGEAARGDMSTPKGGDQAGHLRIFRKKRALPKAKDIKMTPDRVGETPPAAADPPYQGASNDEPRESAADVTRLRSPRFLEQNMKWKIRSMFSS